MGKYEELLALSEEIEAVRKIESLADQVQNQKDALATELQSVDVKALLAAVPDEAREQARLRLTAACSFAALKLDEIMPVKSIKPVDPVKPIEEISK